MSEWQNIKLGDLFQIKHGYAFKGEFFSDHGSYVVLTPGNFFDEGGFKHKDQEKFYTGDIPAGYVLHNGDIIVAMTEQKRGLLGSTAIVPRNDYYLHNQRLGLIHQLDETRASGKYLYYLFNTWIVRDQIQATANGTKVRHTSPSRIYRIEVPFPPLPTQRKIAAILSAYDDLIENNTRRIQALEQAAHDLYREWFVHFRFPGHEDVSLVDSGTEYGAIPQGWEVVKIGTFIKRLKVPHKYKKKEALEIGNTPIIDQSTSAVLGFHNDGADFISSAEKPIAIFGDHSCKLQILTYPFSVAENVVPFVSNDSSTYFVYHIIRSMEFTVEYKRHWTELKERKVIVANDNKLFSKFDDFVKPIFEEVQLLHKQNNALREARDLLLPRLVSGQLDVEDVEILTD